MDFKKIFIKDACPTKIGGQAVLEGIMMKGEDRTAVVVRGEKDRLYIKTEKLQPLPLVSFSFIMCAYLHELYRMC